MSLSHYTPFHRQLLLINIGLMAALEFMQNGMLSFASAYISGGVNAAPEEFSLAAAAYAGTAILMIAKHNWLVERLGYRRFIRLSLLLFTLGALAASCARNPQELIAARMLQALGGSAFFTGARVQVNRFVGAERGVAIRYLACGLIGASALAPWLAARLLESHSWRGIFLGPLLLALPVAILSEITLEEHDDTRERAQLHPMGTIMLAAAACCIQYALERAPYDIFSDGTRILFLLAIGAPCLFVYVRGQFSRPRPVLPFERFMNDRYRAGLLIYGLCYLVLSSSNYMLPIMMQRGLGFPALGTGAILSAAATLSIVVALGHVALVKHYPLQRKYLVIAFLMLAVFGFDLSRTSPDIARWQLLLPLAAFAVFSALGQGTAALNTFAGLDEDVFSQAYQTKNMLRELFNSTGISLATILLQMRSSLHYARLAERFTPGSPGLDPTLTAASGADPARWQTMASAVAQQSTLMASLDFFFAIGCLGTVCVLISLLQRRFR
ncbi:MFS transporter [Paludibacterium yongneupense]|uniref:MFS transporter n=1 Tax=Paludibacterium yongneupense TaxID=400061 RepID=UPI000409E6D7|nr:MFS transporter [Paludibacterium yongneupense]